MKERFTVTASSLGSYFNVGFNTPEQQLAYDLGLEEQTFDEASQDRMDLGSYLEDSVLNYFENKLGITITDRNQEVVEVFDGAMRCKIDGYTVYEGEPTVVECKVSNAQSYKFTENKGYHLQCQAYMVAYNVNQVLLLGLYQGKPIFTLIKRDDRVIGLIQDLVEFLWECFHGIKLPSQFPYQIIEEYNPQVATKEVELLDDDLKLTRELYSLNEANKTIDKRIKEIKKILTEKYENIRYADDEFIITISTKSRSGGVDEDQLHMAYPDINLSQYRKPDSTFSTVTFSKVK